MKDQNNNHLISGVHSDGRFATGMVAAAASMLLPSIGSASSGQADEAAAFYPATAVQDQQVLAYNLVNTKESASNKFRDNGYNYCDAKVLAAFWGEASPYDAKVRLGDKMLRWGPHEAQTFVPLARVQARRQPDSDLPCSYEDGGYSWDDVLLLARYWGSETDLDAKYKMAGLLVDGMDADIQADLQRAQTGQLPAGSGRLLNSGYRLDFSEQDATDKYFSNEYNYCDAKILAAYWDEGSAYDAKLRLGDKMLLGADGEDFVDPAREIALEKPVLEMPCWYDDGGFTYDDAVLLGAYWELENELEAKHKMTTLLVEGKYARIEADLQYAIANHSR